MVSAKAIQSGRLHRFSKRLVAFEHDTPNKQEAKNIILWIGGLGDGMHTVSYPAVLSERLPSQWSLAQVQLLSSLNGWGTGSLQRDVQEIAQCVEYFRQLKGDEAKIVLMGHSTGCQDVMEYVTGPAGQGARPKIDGAILQAPVSDREGLVDTMPAEERRKVIEVAEELVRNGYSNEVIPESLSGRYLGRLPVSAYRWLSLLSPHKDGDDDYFSSDLSDEKLERTFGAFPAHTPLLILCSAEDEHVPAHIHVEFMVKRWSEYVSKSVGVLSASSGVIKGAHHNLEQDDESVMQDLTARVVAFTQEVTSERSHTLPAKLA